MSIQSALVVDDSKVAHIKLRKLLEKHSISVEWVNSGEKAITALESSSPDVVFMDIMMPGIDGFETTKAVLSNPSNTNLAVVMCSGNDSAEDREKADTIGAAGYIRKPYTDEDLSKILDEVSVRIATTQPTAAEPVVEPEAPATEPAEPAPSAAPAIDMAAIIEQATTAGTRAAEQAFAQLSAALKDEVAGIAQAAAKDASHAVADEMEAGLDRGEITTIAEEAANKVVGPRINQAIDKALSSMPQQAPGLDASAVTNAIRHFVTGDDFKRQVASAMPPAPPAPSLDEAAIARVADATAREVAQQAGAEASRAATETVRKVAEETARRAAQEAAGGDAANTEEMVKAAVGGLKTFNIILTLGLIGVIAYLVLDHLSMIPI